MNDNDSVVVSFSKQELQDLTSLFEYHVDSNTLNSLYERFIMMNSKFGTGETHPLFVDEYSIVLGEDTVPKDDKDSNKISVDLDPETFDYVYSLVSWHVMGTHPEIDKAYQSFKHASGNKSPRMLETDDEECESGSIFATPSFGEGWVYKTAIIREKDGEISR